MQTTPTPTLNKTVSLIGFSPASRPPSNDRGVDEQIEGQVLLKWPDEDRQASDMLIMATQVASGIASDVAIHDRLVAQFGPAGAAVALAKAAFNIAAALLREGARRKGYASYADHPAVTEEPVVATKPTVGKPT